MMAGQKKNMFTNICSVFATALKSLTFMVRNYFITQEAEQKEKSGNIVKRNVLSGYNNTRVMLLLNGLWQIVKQNQPLIRN